MENIKKHSSWFINEVVKPELKKQIIMKDVATQFTYYIDTELDLLVITVYVSNECSVFLRHIGVKHGFNYHNYINPVLFLSGTFKKHSFSRSLSSIMEEIRVKGLKELLS